MCKTSTPSFQRTCSSLKEKRCVCNQIGHCVCSCPCVHEGEHGSHTDIKTQAHMHTDTHTHTDINTHARTRTHTHARTHTHLLHSPAFSSTMKRRKPSSATSATCWPCTRGSALPCSRNSSWLTQEHRLPLQTMKALQTRPQTTALHPAPMGKLHSQRRRSHLPFSHGKHLASSHT